MSIASEITRLQTAKANLKTAINNKGGSLTTETIDQYPTAINALQTGIDVSDANAVVGDVLTGKTFYAVDDTKKTGIMVDNGTVNTDITTKAQEVTIAGGKHSGSGKVKISTTEQAKIVADNIKSGVTILGQVGAVTPASPSMWQGFCYFNGGGTSGTRSWTVTVHIEDTNSKFLKQNGEIVDGNSVYFITYGSYASFLLNESATKTSQMSSEYGFFSSSSSIWDNAYVIPLGSTNGTLKNYVEMQLAASYGETLGPSAIQLKEFTTNNTIPQLTRPYVQMLSKKIRIYF